MATATPMFRDTGFMGPGFRDTGCMGPGYMDSGSDVDSVWIGFMDMVPVVGTVKEAVELVLALYEGNIEMVKEKKNAIEDFLKSGSKKENDQMVTKPAEGAAAATFKIPDLKKVKKGMIIECVNNRSEQAVSMNKEQKEKKLKEIKEEMLRKIEEVKKDFKLEVLEEQLTRSKKGEHVFNNNILKFHSKVLDDFIEDNSVYKLNKYNKNDLDELNGHTLLQNTAADIQTNMVVAIELSEFYVNANAIVYGVYSLVLNKAFLKVLAHIKPRDVKDEDKNRVDFVIDKMNEYEIYVDHMAKEKWIDDVHRIRERKKRLKRFEAVRLEVATMYKTDRGVVWSIDILHKVAPWF